MSSRTAVVVLLCVIMEVECMGTLDATSNVTKDIAFLHKNDFSGLVFVTLSFTSPFRRPRNISMDSFVLNTNLKRINLKLSLDIPLHLAHRCSAFLGSTNTS